MTTNNDDTAVQASIEEVSGCSARVDAQVRVVLGRVMAQRRSARTALDYVRGLAPGVKANCWSLAEAAGHEGPYRMQALLGCYRWDWKDLRAGLPALARAWLPCDEGDLTGPGIAVDETAQLKDGDATACVAPQHAGCTGHVENCITTVFSAWVATSGQAWADFDVFVPGRWEKDWRRRRAARIPGKLERKTKPQLAIDQIGRLLAAGLPANQSQARTWDGICRHTALAALAQLRQAAIRNALCGDITLPDAPAGSSHHDGLDGEDDISGADLRIPLGDAPVPARGGQPCPPGIAAIRLTIAETARIETPGRQHAAGLITCARLAFHLRWSRWRRRHQARARWHHYATRLAAVAST